MRASLQVWPRLWKGFCQTGDRLRSCRQCYTQRYTQLLEGQHDPWTNPHCGCDQICYTLAYSITRTETRSFSLAVQTKRCCRNGRCQATTFLMHPAKWLEGRRERRTGQSTRQESIKHSVGLQHVIIRDGSACQHAAQNGTEL